MFKKYILPWLFFIGFIVVLYVLIEKPYLPRVKNTNIFSEMYLQEKDGILPELGKYKGLHVISDRDSENPSRYTYYYKFDDDETAKRSIHVYIYNNDNGQNSDRNIVVSITEETKGGSINGKFLYTGSEIVLRRQLTYSGSTLSFEDFLTSHSYTIESLEAKMTSILNDRVLTDWCSVYDSDYSPDDWGELTVEDWVVEGD